MLAIKRIAGAIFFLLVSLLHLVCGATGLAIWYAYAHRTSIWTPPRPFEALGFLWLAASAASLVVGSMLCYMQTYEAIERVKQRRLVRRLPRVFE